MSEKMFVMRVEGTVKWFNNPKGYGFVAYGDDQDVFIHFSSIQSEGYRTLTHGDTVEFTLNTGRKGLYATDVVKVERPASDSEAAPQIAAEQTKLSPILAR